MNRITLESATHENAVAMSKATYDSAALMKSSAALLEQLGEGLPEDFLNQLNSSLVDGGRAVFDRGAGDRAVFTTRDHTRTSAPAQGTLRVQLANVAGIDVLVTGGWISIVGVTVRVRGK